MNILLIEDSPAMRRMIYSVVCTPADQCHECSDGSEALAAYTEHRPDWVLMDIEMKAMDGITATEQIRASFPEAKVVIVSNYDDPDLRQAALAAGACGYVLKENLLELRQRLQAAG
jgi:CheY-like chemotaxis protein